MPSVSCFIFVARSDASFIKVTLPDLCAMVEKANCKIKVIVDASDPNGVLGRTLEQSKLTELLEILEEIKRRRSFDIEVFAPSHKEVLKLSKIHLGKAYVETHCFRGYPVHASIRQFHNHESEYILHLDCDMIFHESPEYSWIKEGISLMEQNADILCVLPRGGPPTDNGSLHQGSTSYKVDKKRNAYLFKNFTSRHYLVHRKRFLELLPIKPLWLSWREPIKSMLFGNGKMLCWESMVEHAMNRSNFWRADLMSHKAWSIHPGERSEQFRNLLPRVINRVNQGEYPDEQAGHFDLILDSWETFINEKN